MNVRFLGTFNTHQHNLLKTVTLFWRFEKVVENRGRVVVHGLLFAFCWEDINEPRNTFRMNGQVYSLGGKLFLSYIHLLFHFDFLLPSVVGKASTNGSRHVFEGSRKLLLLGTRLLFDELLFFTLLSIKFRSV
jgi:hypothetical protein